MPVISMFYGIIVRMYLLDDTQSTTCRTCTPDMRSLKPLSAWMMARCWRGQIPRKQLRLVQAWIELHRDELVADWALASSGELPYKIEPL